MNLRLGPKNLAVDFSFTIPNRSELSVLCSGGLDSTALLALCLEELAQTARLTKTKVRALTAIKWDASTYYSKNTVAWLSDHYSINIEHVNNLENWDLHEGRLSAQTMNRVRDRYYGQGPIYLAVNRMAPPELKEYRNPLKIAYSAAGPFQKPFLTLHKPQILDIYYQLGLEPLIELTHSCDAQPVGACGDCYSCEERSWGFSELVKTDPGTRPVTEAEATYGGQWRSQ